MEHSNEELNSSTPPSDYLKDNTNVVDNHESSRSELKQLPEPPTDPSVPTKELKLGGEGVAMDEMGPMIVGQDGSIRRIANWESMTKSEQAVAWRRISARNKQRLEALRNNPPVEPTEEQQEQPAPKKQLKYDPEYNPDESS